MKPQYFFELVVTLAFTNPVAGVEEIPTSTEPTPPSSNIIPIREPPSTQAQLNAIFKYIDDNSAQYIEELKKAVAIANVASWGSQRPTYTKMWKMITLIQDKLTALGASVKLRKVGKPQIMDDGMEEPLPPVIFASLGNSPSKGTLLIYGHLDVQPAKQTDGWDSDPFTLTPREGNLYGRGTTDNKGPVLGWLHALQAFIWAGVELPINIKIILESGEDLGSVGLEDLLKEEAELGDGFFLNVANIAISDNSWVGRDTPCLIYGLRGLLPFQLLVEGGSKDLHSGIHGGAIREPLDDLIWMLGSLKGPKGEISPIPGVMVDVDERSPEERNLYTELQFTLENYRNETGGAALLYPESKEDTLMARWRYPSISIHGIEGAFSDPGFKTIIPNHVVGKFSLRLVPHQDPKNVGEAVGAFLDKKWQERGSPNRFEAKLQKLARPWLGDRTNPNFKAAAAAIRTVYGKDPQYTRSGEGNPIVKVLEELTKSNVLLIPMGQSDDNPQGQNEKISVRNYLEGTKVFAAYFLELGNLKNVSVN